MTSPDLPRQQRERAEPPWPLLAPTPRRGLWLLAKRLATTAVGVVLILLGAAFTSPFPPGPATLPVMAGLVLLAHEYDCARALRHRVHQQVGRLWDAQRAWWPRRAASPRTRGPATS